MKNNVAVSILVPVFGVEKYIERCARSLFEQTYENIEYVFVDDCSPDKSIKVLEKVLDDYPNRKPCVRIIHHKKNRGLAEARNTAVENCQTEFLIHVDSDDYIDKSLIIKCVEQQRKTDSDIVLFDFMMLKSYGVLCAKHKRCLSVHERTLNLLARQTSVCVWGGFYRSSLYKKNGIAAVEGVNNNEDYQVSPRLSYYSKKITFLDDTLYFYDCTNESSITQHFSEFNAEQGWKSIQILTDFFSDKGIDYMDALQKATIDRIAIYLKYSIKTGNKDYFYKMKEKYQKVSDNFLNTVPLHRRVYLLIDSYLILNLYTKLCNGLIRLKRVVKKA